MNLTEKTVAALTLPDGKSDAIYFDDKVPGFGIRLRAKGAATWVFQAKLGGTQLRMTLGKAAAMKAGAARAIAEGYHADVKAGRNPQTEKRVKVAQQASTFGQLVEQYLAEKAKTLKPRSLVEVTRHLNVYAKPLHRMPVAAIDKTQVANLIKKIGGRSGPRIRDGVVTANRMRASLSAMFVWAMKETDYVEANPVINTHKAGKEKSRTRVLKDSEIRIIWNALDDGDHGDIIRLLLLTGQRLNEIAGLRWKEVEFDRNRIVLPEERVKNKRPHAVAMSGSVRAILEARHAKRTEGEALVFNYRSWTHGRKVLDERIEQANDDAALEHWTPHDLRRTCATRMAEDLQVQPHVIEAILNHVSGHKHGVAGIYNLATYMAEKTAALTLWADHVAAIIEGRQSNVMPLYRAG